MQGTKRKPKQGERLDGVTRFRDAVITANYGDDNEGCVRRHVKYYNMASYQKFMAKHGIVVTMPDKSPEMVEFMPILWDFDGSGSVDKRYIAFYQKVN